MKTHDLSRALTTLAKVLKSAPNVEVDELDLTANRVSPTAVKNNAPAALAVLASFASFSKAQWVALIRELNLDVPVKPTDSTRDILGRLLAHLNENESVVHRLAHEARKPSANVSPELMNALSILLKR